MKAHPSEGTRWIKRDNKAEGRAGEGEGSSAHLMGLPALFKPGAPLSSLLQWHGGGEGLGTAGANSSSWTLISSSIDCET